jgi:hypothetical protein
MAVNSDTEAHTCIRWLGNNTGSASKADPHVDIVYTPHVKRMLPYCNMPSRIPDKHK